MHVRARQAITTAASGALLTGTVIVAVNALSPEPPAIPSPHLKPSLAAAAGPAALPLARPAMTIQPVLPAESVESVKRAEPAKPKAAFPSGTATATSFWDGQTASGKPMGYQTIASPYWPLGTKVKVTYRGRTATGVVEDFGPAEWAVAQHDIPAILDLSERMMADLTGTRSNTVHVRFEVLEWGKGRSYRRGGTGYKLAMGKS
jgi:hypothetical protein